MRLYINIKKMDFIEENNEIEHEIILSISEEESIGYDYMIELPDNDKFIRDVFKIIYKKDKKGKETKEIENKVFIVREQKTWWSFPTFEIIKGKIITFDYNKYAYFSGTDRRMILAKKINQLYNIPSEAKLHRKILKKILDNLGMVDEGFEKYNTKIEEVIKKIPKLV